MQITGGQVIKSKNGIRSFRLSGGTTVSQTSELVADKDNEEEDNNDSPSTVGEEIAWR